MPLGNNLIIDTIHHSSNHDSISAKNPASYPGQFAPSEFPTSLTGDVTSQIAEDDWERGCKKT